MKTDKVPPIEYGPLVSVIVLAYQSSAFILETLESIKNQSYRNIQLVITDDCSRDDTAKLGAAWLSDHGGRFVESTLVKTLRNEGIVANCNNGLGYAKGEWVKLIGADDILLEHCLSNNVAYAAAHPEVSVVFSGMQLMDEQSRVYGSFPSPSAYFSYPPERQLFWLLHHNYLPTVSAFIRRPELVENGGFDLMYPMMEDYPYWVDQLAKGRLFGYMDKMTVSYRKHGHSVSSEKKFNAVFVRSRNDCDRRMRLPMARERSKSLARKVRMDIFLFDVQVNHPVFFSLLYFFAWARVKWEDIFNPFALPNK